MLKSNIILEPFQLNDIICLSNRIIMAPMTRNMANDDLSPTPEMLAYYARRADTGLIVTEGTIIRPDGRGYSNTPGIYTSEHVEGWKKITRAVHEKGGKIFLQIWHVGRVSHPTFLAGALPISPSSTNMVGRIPRAKELYYSQSRALSLAEIKDLITSYEVAALRAMEAGFDGIEIHGANGYLIDQFLHYHTNKRTDKYGLLPENLARFALDIIDHCIEKIGHHRVGIRLSPGAYLNEIIGDERDKHVFQYLLKQLTSRKIAYLHTGNFDDTIRFPELDNKTMTEFMRLHYQGNLVASGSYTIEKAIWHIKQNNFDLLALGRPFIANPDLIERLKASTELKAYEASMLQNLF